MATYEYKCLNPKCEDFNKIKECSIPMSDYSEDKLPKCEKCSISTDRHYSGFSHGTFGDGYKG